MNADRLVPFRLHPDATAEKYAAAFERDRRVRVRPFLSDECATALHSHLRGRADWRQIINSGDKVFELDRRTREDMTAAQRAALEEAVLNGARTGFQYRYESLRLPDGNAESPATTALADFTRWMSDGPARDFLRGVTGCADIAFADGQATAYSPGDFLTGHDDEVAGKHRRAAYVLGLTPVWRAEWGGLLLFHGDEGAVSGVSPGFNSIDLFAVPQLHSVSRVAPEAAYRRYAITGWLRANDRTTAHGS